MSQQAKYPQISKLALGHHPGQDCVQKGILPDIFVWNVTIVRLKATQRCRSTCSMTWQRFSMPTSF
jgi:hypothetical protein